MNERQQEVVESNDDHLLCCACPGSGKTRVLTHRARHILAGDPAARIIMVTFSREATEEMRRRLGTRNRNVVIGSYHALALSQLKRAKAAGRIVSGVGAAHLVEKALAETGCKAAVEEAIEFVSRCKTDPGYAQANPEFAAVAEVYQRMIEAQQCWDFTDLLLKAVTGMEAGTVPPLPARHILCDEFQDIDPIQFRWLMCHLGQACRSVAVGDDDQSIYRFRNAMGYRGMMEYVAATGARVITLDVNYRSTSAITDTASTLIANNVDRVHKRMWASRGDGPPPVVRHVRNANDRADALLSDLEAICGANPGVTDAFGRVRYRFGVKAGQVAILARTNFQLTDIHRTLLDLRVPCIRMGNSLWDTRPAMVYMDLLAALAESGSLGIEVALRWAHVPDAIIGELRRLAGGELVDLLRQGAVPLAALPGGPAVREFVAYGRGWWPVFVRPNAGAEVGAKIAGVANWMIATRQKICGLDADEATEVVDKRAWTEPDQRDIEILETARDMLVGFRGNLRQRLRAARQEKDDKIQRVVLSTYHAAKGLEWDHVILTDVVDGQVPKLMSDADDEALAEERRLFYVAMTRARDRLYIYTRKNEESEFLMEAGILRGGGW